MRQDGKTEELSLLETLAAHELKDLSEKCPRRTPLCFAFCFQFYTRFSHGTARKEVLAKSGTPTTFKRWSELWERGSRQWISLPDISINMKTALPLPT